MFIEFTTTITHKIEIGDEGIEGVSHSVEIDPGPDGMALGQSGLMTVAAGGCKAAIFTIEGGNGPDAQDFDNAGTGEEEEPS